VTDSVWYAGLIIDPAEFPGQLSRLNAVLARKDYSDRWQPVEPMIDPVPESVDCGADVVKPVR
jgi:hypothetical protein